MAIPNNKNLRQYSRILRTGMTDSEIKLWAYLRLKQVNGLQFYRQKPFGKYIVDFYCPKARLVIEVDGGQHYEEHYLREDRIRDEFLSKSGFKVLRYSDTEVLTNIEGVMENLLDEIRHRSSNLP